VTGAIAKQTTPPASPAVQAAAPAAEPSPAPSPTANLGAIPQAKAPPAPPIQPMVPPQSQTPPPSVAPVASAPPAPQSTEKPRADVAAAKPEPAPAATPAPAPAQFASSASALAAGSTSPLIAPKSIMGPPDPAAPKLIEAPKLVASPAPVAPAAPPAAQTASQAAAAGPAKDQDTPQASEVIVHRTEFAVDLGSANSVTGLRVLWRSLVKSNADLAELRPIIVVKESTTGLGMQLRLAAGPLHDAAAAAKICASLMENKRACETTVFDGQRLAMAADEQGGEKPGEVKPAPYAYKHSYYPKRGKKDEPPAKPESSSLSSLLGISGKK
jgi:hypothetical protein